MRSALSPLSVAVAALAAALCVHLTSAGLLLSLPSPGHDVPELGWSSTPWDHTWAVAEPDGSAVFVAEKTVCTLRLPSPVPHDCIRLPAPVQATPVASPQRVLVGFGAKDYGNVGPGFDPSIGYALVGGGLPPRVERLSTGGLHEWSLHVSWVLIHRPDRFEIHRWDCNHGVSMRVGLDGTPGEWKRFAYPEESVDCLLGFAPGDPAVPIFPLHPPATSAPYSARRVFSSRVLSDDDGWSIAYRGEHVLLTGRAPDGRQVPVARVGSKYPGNFVHVDTTTVLILEGNRIVVLDDVLGDASPLGPGARASALYGDIGSVDGRYRAGVRAYVALLAIEPGALLAGALALRRKTSRRVRVGLAVALLAIAASAVALIVAAWPTAMPW